MGRLQPDEVRLADLPGGGLRADLPDRPGAPESVGRVLVGAWLVACGVLAAVVVIRNAVSSGLPYVLAFLPFCVAAAAGGLWLLREGFLDMIGFRRAIEVRGDRVRAIDRRGLLGRRRSRPLQVIQAFVLRPEKAPSYDPRRGAYRLEADCGGRTFLLADRCPRPLLARLADRLAEACRAGLTASGREAPPLPVRVEAPAAEPGPPTVRPADAQATPDAAGGFRLVLPPLGFWRAAKAPFIFCLIWFTVTYVFTYQVVLGGMAPKTIGVGIGLVLFLSIIWAAGLFILTRTLGMVCTRTTVAVEGRFLAVTLDGPFGTRRRHWPVSAIDDFEIGTSASLPASRGGPPIPELRIRFKTEPPSRRGPSFGILAGRDERELRWAAESLREAVAEAARRPPPPEPATDEPPAGSGASAERTADGIRIKVPPVGLRGKAPWVAGGGVLTGAAASAGGWAVWDQVPGPWTVPIWAGAALIALVGLFAFALALEAVAFALCRRLLRVEDEVLSVWETTWWGGVRMREWRRSRITAIDVGPPNPAGAYLVFPKLRIHPQDAKPVGLLLYHDEAELLWVAALLREILRLPASARGS